VNDLTLRRARHLNAGAIWADTPKRVAAVLRSGLYLAADAARVQKVGTGENGLMEGLRPGSAWFDCHECGGRGAGAACAIAEKGIHSWTLRSSGGPSGANSGKLAIWIGATRRSSINTRRSSMRWAIRPLNWPDRRRNDRQAVQTRRGPR